MYQRILVTGANGLLGQALVARLSASVMYDVLATGNNPAPRFSGLSCGFVPMDICDREAVSRVFEDFAPSIVINCAAMTDVDGCEERRNACWRINATSVERLARECHAIGAWLIQLSTDFVFDGKAGPYTEEGRPNPVNYYGKAKLAGENAARQAGIGKWTVVRTNVVYGTGRSLPRSNFMTWVRRTLRSGTSIRVFTDQIRTPTYVHDLSDGIGRIVRHGKRGVYNLSGPELLSMYDFALQIAAAYRLDVSLVNPTTASAMAQRALRPRTTGLIILKAASELDYSPRSITQALAHLKHRTARDLCLN